MDANFELPITYKGAEKILQARLLKLGFSYKIEVEMDDDILLFEPDEERNWRAVIHPSADENKRAVDPQLYKAVAEALESIFR